MCNQRCVNFTANSGPDSRVAARRNATARAFTNMVVGHWGWLGPTPDFTGFAFRDSLVTMVRGRDVKEDNYMQYLVQLLHIRTPEQPTAHAGSLGEGVRCRN